MRHIMRTDQERIRKFLDLGEFEELFNYLGWDNLRHELFASREDGARVTPVAQKRGVGVWRVDGIPLAAARRRIDRDVSRLTRERLLIFDGGDRQLWLWPETRPSGSGHHLVTHEYHPETRNEALIQRLAAVAFSVEEERDLTVMDVLHRVRGQFKADKITKQFYKEFRQNRERLTGFIEGIEAEKDREWYGTVLLNRLMFIYFLQKKGFLEGDRDYLRNRLMMVRKLLGKDSFYGFFRKFMLPLFHEGLGSHRHLYEDPKIAEIIGDIPYVNGAIFDPHKLEEEHDINIRDLEFERIFDFFDQYRWHLDERPTHQPNEISPDVLGYVFEQLINQKEQGAYYTKEDITGYMTSVTVIPALLDRLDVDDDPLELLTADPERYIHESVSYGLDQDLPEDIAAGAADPAQIADEDWFEKAPPHIGLPGETWWETIDRHRHYRQLKKRVADGEIRTVDDAITANLDLRTLVTDFLGMLTPMEAVERAYRTLQELTVLDPTCGSGAFLFAALDILADCYKTLLERAEELSIGDDTPDILREADEHPSRKKHDRMYFIYKQAMLNNLYGVDIMPEAGEIARLRMFLKLAAQLTDPDKIDPLPDLDFNIKTGNLLVGIAHLKDAHKRLNDIIGYPKLQEIEDQASPLANIMEEFSQAQQTNDNPDKIQGIKNTINKEKRKLRDQLDKHLYEIRAEQEYYEQWRKSHQPFHWFAEFPNVFISKDGFDIIIGNPPYITRTKVIHPISLEPGWIYWQRYQTNHLTNIFTVCVERTLSLINTRSRYSMILPVSFQFRNSFKIVRDLVTKAFPLRWISTYDKDPDQLFEGVKVRVAILSGSKISQKSHKTLAVTRFNRWLKDYRNCLFDNLRHTILPEEIEYNSGWLKIGSSQEGQILRALISTGKTINSITGGPHELTFKAVIWHYLSSFIDPPPAYDLYGNPIEQPAVKTLNFPTSELRNASFVLSLSKVALMWWSATGDGLNLPSGALGSTPIPESIRFLEDISQLAPDIQKGLKDTLKYVKNAKQWVGNYDVREIRYLTDEIDKRILSEIGLDDLWPNIQLFNATFMKQSGGKSALLEQPKFIQYW